MNTPVARSLLSRPWFWLSISAALVSAVGSIVGLLDPSRVFGKETATLFESSIAQDLVNLFLVAPLTVILSIMVVRGSLRSWFCLVGVLGFTAYNYAIYAFSIHFGMLFLVWVTVLPDGFSWQPQHCSLCSGCAR